MKHYGLDWVSDGPDEWCAKTGRFTIRIWMFGPRYQCVVNVDYAGAEEPVHIGLPISDTKKEAMEAGLSWITQFTEYGVDEPEATLKTMYTRYKMLYQYRWQALEQLYFVIGNGYSWLDGGIVCNAPYDYLEFTDIPEKKSKLEKMAGDLEKGSKLEKIVSEIIGRRERSLVVGPHTDEGKPLRLYPVAKGYSNILLVPDDVTDAWLQVSYEAALILRDRSDVSAIGDDSVRQINNHKLGIKVVEGLEERFGDRLFAENYKNEHNKI